MFLRQPIAWLVTLFAVLATGEGLGRLLMMQGYTTAGTAVRIMIALAAVGWLIAGLIRFRQVLWVKRASQLLGFTVFMYLVVMVFHSLGSTGGVIGTVGIWAMATGFWLCLRLVRLLLVGGRPVIGVARTLIDEAIRMRVVIVLFVAMLLMLAWIPFGMDPAEKLQYRIQSFLSWSIMVSMALLSLMTLLIAAWTISSEIENHQIFLTLTKPVSRCQYLLGKFLGIVILNLILVYVLGSGIYAFTLILANQSAINTEDRMAVDEQVLVARNAVLPQPSDYGRFQEMFTQRLEQLRRENPKEWGQPGEPDEWLTPKMREAVNKQIMIDWFKLPPQEWRTFLFTNLQTAQKRNQQVQLRLKPSLIQDSPDGFVRLQMRINGRSVPVPKLSGRTFHVLPVDARHIDQDGRLEIQLGNITPGQPTVILNTSDGLMMLYRVGGFEGNLLKALCMLWVRLCFLAMLGLAAGSFLGFPVACLTCLVFYFIAAYSGFLLESLAEYVYLPTHKYAGYELIQWIIQRMGKNINEGEYWDVAKMAIRMVGHTILFFVPSLSDYSPTASISEGINISYGYLMRAVLWVGLIWTGLLTLISYLLFKGRELARVTV